MQGFRLLVVYKYWILQLQQFGTVIQQFAKVERERERHFILNDSVFSFFKNN
jgi:hypothetical protein